jgi:magnesium transporter
MATDSTWDDSDIFRGEPPPPPRAPSPTPSRHSTVSTSSSGSYLGGRLGAIAAIVELAISRWAGNESSGSSSSSSSDSDSVAHSRAARRSHRSKSEHDISTRISRMQAREESRQIPRQFALYVPPPLASPDANSQRITHTSDLSTILGQLDTALKRSTRARRQQERERLPRADLDPPKPQHLHFMLPDVVKSPSRAASFTDLSALGDGQRKGKYKEGQVPHTTSRSPSMPKAWFLDVSSPTYAWHTNS